MNKRFIILVFSLSAVVGFQSLENDQFRLIPKNFAEFMDEFQAEQGFEHLKINARKTIASCGHSFEKASEKFYDILSLSVIEKEKNDAEELYDLKADIIDEADEMLSALSNDIGENDIFDEKLSIIEEPDFVGAHFVKQAEIVLRAMGHACSSLPNALAQSRSKRSPTLTMENLVRSLTHWMQRWTTSLEMKLDKFIDSCLKHKPCKPFLIKILEHWLDFMKHQNNELGMQTSGILQQLIDDIKWTGIKHSHLTDIQKLAISPHFDDFYNERSEDSFNFAQQVSGFKEEENMDFQNVLASFSQASKFWLSPTKGEIEIETEKLAAKIPETFLSVAFGSNLIKEHFQKLKSRYSELVALASAFSPAILRVGGSAANFLTFDPTSMDNTNMKDIRDKFVYSVNHPKLRAVNEELVNAYEVSLAANPSSKHPKRKAQERLVLLANELNAEESSLNQDRCQPQMQKTFENFTMTVSEMNFLAKLVQDLDWTLLFDLNQFYRDEHDNWDPTNARMIFEQAKKQNLKIIWQLGNEPNNYDHKFNWEVSPERAAKDYLQLKQELQSFKIDHKIVGPDVTRPRNIKMENDQGENLNLGLDSMQFLTTFLEGAESIIDAVTFHQYYMDGKIASLEDFMSPEIMNIFPKQLFRVTELVNKLAPNKPIIITETASAWGGGAPGLSNSFAGGFLWLDKLGAAALGGVSGVVRQTLYGGCYALLDNNLNPNPDYWVSVLHKQLVGEGVLHPKTRLVPDSVRLYAHCLNPRHNLYKPGAVVLFGMNTATKPETVTLFSSSLQSSDVYKYKLSAPKNDMISRHILLNGLILEPMTGGELPELIPVQEVNTRELLLSPKTIYFWVFPDAGVPVC